MRAQMRRKQQLYFDGVEQSLAFVELSYHRLVDSLADDSRDLHSRMSFVLLDCWAIIDASKRLRTLLQNTPGLKQNSVLKNFYAQTAFVPNFRHYVQHMEEKASGQATTGWPIWGVVSWPHLQEDGRILVHLYAPGRISKCKNMQAVNPLGRECAGPIDHVELSIDENTRIRISELVRDIKSLGERFLSEVKKAELADDRDQNQLVRVEIPELDD